MDGSDHIPEISRLIAAIDATWPAAELAEAGGFRLRRGAGGGKRVSAATPLGQDWDDAGIKAAEAAMRAWAQVPHGTFSRRTIG